MPKPYSNDLRTRVLQFYENHADYTQPELAEEFGVSLSTLEKWLQRWRATGSSAALPPAGGRSASLQNHETALHKLVAQQPDATLEELQQKLLRRRRVSVHPATISRALARLGLGRKKKPPSPVNKTDLL
jgi:transposase